MLEELLDLYAYHRWAHRRILGAVTALSAEEVTRDLGGSFPTVLATLEHLLWAEWVWVERWEHRSPAGAPADWDLSKLSGLLQRWDEVEGRQAAFVSGLAAEDLREALHYRNTAGEAFVAPLGQLLLHVVNHGSYHRGQLANMLRLLGSSAPSTDLVVFHRERAGARG